MLKLENHWLLETLAVGKDIILASHGNQNVAEQVCLCHFPPATPPAMREGGARGGR